LEVGIACRFGSRAVLLRLRCFQRQPQPSAPMGPATRQPLPPPPCLSVWGSSRSGRAFSLRSLDGFARRAGLHDQACGCDHEPSHQ
jgi:hypothetical protein